MRAFYVVLAALAFFCETNTVSATGQTELSKLVKPEELIRSEIGHGIGNNPRRLRGVETEVDDEDDDEDEDEDDEEGKDDQDEEERAYSELWRSTVIKLHNANARVDDVVNPNTLGKLRGAKTIGQLSNAKNLEDFVNPNLIVLLYKTNQEGLAKYVGKDLFPILARQGVKRGSLELTLQNRGLSENAIKLIGDQFDFYRTFVARVPLV